MQEKATQHQIQAINRRVGLGKTYTLCGGNTEKWSESNSSSGSEQVPSNKIGKSDGSSSRSVHRTALSCSCAWQYKYIEGIYEMHSINFAVTKNMKIRDCSLH